MAIKVAIPSAQETIEKHAKLGWRCPECYGGQVDRRPNRFGGTSEDRLDMERTCRQVRDAPNEELGLPPQSQGHEAAN